MISNGSPNNHDGVDRTSLSDAVVAACPTPGIKRVFNDRFTEQVGGYEQDTVSATRPFDSQDATKNDEHLSATGISVILLDVGMWNMFHERCNEMIVTREGRRMFPVIKIKVEGLDPAEMYKFCLDFKLVDKHRWKYINGEWNRGAKSDIPEFSRLYTHPDSPNFGRYWMEGTVSFSRTKITNKEDDDGSKIFLNSMYKYLPRVHIYKISGDKPTVVLLGTFSFQQTEFIAVTAYQNERVTGLKVRYNPFAKAFLEPRENGDSLGIARGGQFQRACYNPRNTYSQELCGPKYSKESDRLGFDQLPCANYRRYYDDLFQSQGYGMNGVSSINGMNGMPSLPSMSSHCFMECGSNGQHPNSYGLSWPSRLTSYYPNALQNMYGNCQHMNSHDPFFVMHFSSNSSASYGSDGYINGSASHIGNHHTEHSSPTTGHTKDLQAKADKSSEQVNSPPGVHSYKLDFLAEMAYKHSESSKAPASKALQHQHHPNPKDFEKGSI